MIVIKSNNDLYIVCDQAYKIYDSYDASGLGSIITYNFEHLRGRTSIHFVVVITDNRVHFIVASGPDKISRMTIPNTFDNQAIGSMIKYYHDEDNMSASILYKNGVIIIVDYDLENHQTKVEYSESGLSYDRIIFSPGQRIFSINEKEIIQISGKNLDKIDLVIKLNKINQLEDLKTQINFREIIGVSQINDYYVIVEPNHKVVVAQPLFVYKLVEEQFNDNSDSVELSGQDEYSITNGSFQIIEYNRLEKTVRLTINGVKSIGFGYGLHIITDYNRLYMISSYRTIKITEIEVDLPDMELPGSYYVTSTRSLVKRARK